MCLDEQPERWPNSQVKKDREDIGKMEPRPLPEVEAVKFVQAFDCIEYDMNSVRQVNSVRFANLARNAKSVRTGEIDEV